MVFDFPPPPLRKKYPGRFYHNDFFLYIIESTKFNFVKYEWKTGELIEAAKEFN